MKYYYGVKSCSTVKVSIFNNVLDTITDATIIGTVNIINLNSSTSKLVLYKYGVGSHLATVNNTNCGVKAHIDFKYSFSNVEFDTEVGSNYDDYESKLKRLNKGSFTYK